MALRHEMVAHSNHARRKVRIYNPGDASGRFAFDADHIEFDPPCTVTSIRTHVLRLDAALRAKLEATMRELLRTLGRTMPPVGTTLLADLAEGTS